MENKEFILQFKNGKLNPAQFDHEAHLRMAYLYLNKFRLEKAKKDFCVDLKNYVQEVGAEDKYHHTLTIAAIEMVNHFMQKSKTKNFKDFINEFPRLKTNFKELIAQHYSFDIFQNEKARKEFIEPDLISFD